MRDLKHRLERLERDTRQAVRGMPQILVCLYGAKDGNAEPWEPTWARCERLGDAQRITRERGESPEAFEARARSAFPDRLVLMGCK